MKQYIRKYLLAFLSILLAINVFIYNSLTVYAIPKRLLDGTWIDIPLSEAAEEASYYIQYGLSTIGVVVNGDFEQWLKNSEAYRDLYDDNGRLAKNISVDTETGNVTYNKEIMIVLKNAVDDYAKQNEPYYFVNTLTLSDCAGSPYNGAKIAYDTVKNLLDDSPSGIVAWGCYYSKPTQMWFVDIGNDFKNVSPVKYNNNTLFVNFYDNETWGLKSYTAYKVDVGADGEAISSADEFKDKAQHTYNNNNINTNFRVYPFGNTSVSYPYNVQNATQWLSLITKERRRIRVFNTYGDFQNYTLGKRSVYYTSNYYNYVPEDITTSVDDLQKSVDDLQNVLDNLLDQITKDTDESEIEDLLQQILDELKNQQGTGNGNGGSSGGGDVTINVDMTQTNTWLAKIYAKVSDIFDKIQSSGSDGSGGGDVTVNVDLSTTNNWLSMIYTKVSQIYDKISEAAGQSMSEVVDSISDLSKMLKKYLSTITSDLDDIKDQLEDMSEQEFSEKTESFLDDTMDSFWEISEKAKGKFPFSIPNDIRLLISKMSVSQPEDPGQGTYSVMTMAYDEDVGSNDLIMVMDDSGGDIPVISETGAPIFYIPFVIASAGIDEYVVIDLSGFESISSYCRSLMTIFFILCLFNLTFKVMGLWGDLVD